MEREEAKGRDIVRELGNDRMVKFRDRIERGLFGRGRDMREL